MNDEKDDELKNAQIEQARTAAAKNRAEVLHWLAERARNRFEVRQAIDWKVSIGLWTALGAGAGVILASGDWAPGELETWLGVALVIFVIAGYGCAWQRFIRRTLDEDRRVSIHYETEICKAIGTEPKLSNTANRGTTDAQIAQLGVTVVFAILFVGALFSKAHRYERPASAKSGFRIEGGSLEVDSPQKFKLGGREE